MVRSLPHPSVFADLDAKRIAGNSAVVLLHVVAFALLMVPSRWEPPMPAPRELVVVPIVTRPVPIPTPPPPPEQAPRLPEQRPQQNQVVAPRVDDTPMLDDSPVLDIGSEPALPDDGAGPVVDSFDPGPPLATLAYDVFPAPRYPRQALRQHAEGVVTLKVLVDEQGRPREVAIERSSGNRYLDQAARDQVLAKWRFHPATREGRAIAAYALVPIAFNLP